MDQSALEEQLTELVEASSDQNKARWALGWKRTGKKVIGVLDSYVPEEVIFAAGMLPWRMFGTRRTGTPLGIAYRGAQACPYGTHVVESVLSGEIDFLDGLVTTPWDIDLLRVWDLLMAKAKPGFGFAMYMPRIRSDIAIRQFAKEIETLRRRLGTFGDVEISEADLRHAVSVYDHTRYLLAKVYELRKRPVPPISGAEALGMTIAAMVMPRDEYNRRLEAIIPYLEGRHAPVAQVSPRVLVSSDFLDEPKYLKVIEDAGMLVAMDDLDTGSRYSWLSVGAGSEDLVLALAKRYVNRPACPRMSWWPDQMTQLRQWVTEFGIQGIIELPLIHSEPRQMRGPFFHAKLAEWGIPAISIRHDYALTNASQLATRVEAFREMLEADLASTGGER